MQAINFSHLDYCKSCLIVPLLKILPAPSPKYMLQTPGDPLRIMFLPYPKPWEGYIHITLAWNPKSLPWPTGSTWSCLWPPPLRHFPVILPCLLLTSHASSSIPLTCSACSCVRAPLCRILFPSIPPRLALLPHSQFISVQSLSHVWIVEIPQTTVHQASLSITNSRSLLKLMSIQSVMPSNHLILCRPLLLPPSIFPSIRFFSNDSALHIRWPKYGSFSFTISPSNEYSGLIYFRTDWLDLLAV